MAILHLGYMINDGVGIREVASVIFRSIDPHLVIVDNAVAIACEIASPIYANMKFWIFASEYIWKFSFGYYNLAITK